MDPLCHVFRPAKLLICFLDRHRGDLLVAISKGAGARGGTIAPGRALADSRISLSQHADPAEEIRKLLALPGIGPWTAQYVAMRAMAEVRVAILGFYAESIWHNSPDLSDTRFDLYQQAGSSAIMGYAQIKAHAATVFQRNYDELRDNMNRVLGS